MAPKDTPITIYSNIMQVRITPAELVLEFGVFFPDSGSPPQPGPKDFTPEARVVMQVAALEQLKEALLKASEARKVASQPGPVSKAQ